MLFIHALRHFFFQEKNNGSSLTLARTWGGVDATPPGRLCALYPLFLKLEI